MPANKDSVIKALGERFGRVEKIISFAAHSADGKVQANGSTEIEALTLLKKTLDEIDTATNRGARA